MTVKKYDNEKVIKKEYRDKNIQSSKEEYYCDGVVLYVSGFWRVH
jgi:benzoyl-CoA reductase/2-hydroxyglutaryl-CoA dehydratase subunit BcrC/BadD/HgdB